MPAAQLDPSNIGGFPCQDPRRGEEATPATLDRAGSLALPKQPSHPTLLPGWSSRWPGSPQPKPSSKLSPLRPTAETPQLICHPAAGTPSPPAQVCSGFSVPPQLSVPSHGTALNPVTPRDETPSSFVTPKQGLPAHLPHHGTAPQPTCHPTVGSPSSPVAPCGVPWLTCDPIAESPRSPVTP